MPRNNLRIAFADQDLQRFLASGSNVVVAKQEAKVAWVVFRPLSSNTVSWEDNYGIYASETELRPGAVISHMARTAYPATVGMSYELGPNGAFTGPRPGYQPGSYTAVNSYPTGRLAFGLFQDAVVNERQLAGNAVSAASTYSHMTVSFTPSPVVCLWIQSQVVSSSVLGPVTSPQTRVTFGPETDVSLRYDPASGTFVSARTATASDAVSVEYLEPAL